MYIWPSIQPWQFGTCLTYLIPCGFSCVMEILKIKIVYSLDSFGYYGWNYMSWCNLKIFLIIFDWNATDLSEYGWGGIDLYQNNPPKTYLWWIFVKNIIKLLISLLRSFDIFWNGGFNWFSISIFYVYELRRDIELNNAGVFA